MTTNQFSNHTLANGLQVLIKEMHHAPVASFWVWYRVGSRNERAGLTGASHWVEHMLFRGTERFPSGAVHKLVAREGGTRNGFTSLDFTAYFETLPADRIELALQLESDRMLNARFAPEDVEAERTIIISERAGHENSPGFLLDEAMTAATFSAHPYGHTVLGSRADLTSMTRDDLWQHYRTFYAPNNAIVVALVGRFRKNFRMPMEMDLSHYLLATGQYRHPVPPDPLTLIWTRDALSDDAPGLAFDYFADPLRTFDLDQLVADRRGRDAFEIPPPAHPSRLHHTQATARRRHRVQVRPGGVGCVAGSRQHLDIKPEGTFSLAHEVGQRECGLAPQSSQRSGQSAQPSKLSHPDVLALGPAPHVWGEIVEGFDNARLVEHLGSQVDQLVGRVAVSYTHLTLPTSDLV